VRIAILPISSDKNPYQKLTLESLRNNGFQVFYGEDVKLFPIFRTCKKSKPDYLHFDWIQRYTLTKYSKLNWLICILFALDIQLSKLFFKTKIVWTLHNIYPHLQGKTIISQWIRTFFAKKVDWIRVFHERTVEKVITNFKVSEKKI